MSPRSWLAAFAVLVCAAPARAEDDVHLIDHPLRRGEPTREDLHIDAAVIWAAIELAIPGMYYWNTKSQQDEDWTLDGSWSSWKKKLTLQTIGFDTNEFMSNSVRHPLTGIGDYQIARSNGFGVVGAEMFTVGLGVFWEYVIEYREDQALNDIVMNGIGGIAIGEPLYQLGQLWRSHTPSLLDRAHTAAFSPFDAVQDTVRVHPLLVRPKAWSELRFTSGWARRQVDPASRYDVATLSLDADLVNHPDYLRSGERSSRVGVGAWSRVNLEGRFGKGGDDNGLVGVMFQSRTTLGGMYWQDGGGHGVFAGVGTGFEYHREWLGGGWDHGVYAHLLGPQAQLVLRRDGRELRWDVAGYGDFAMLDAHAFVGSPGMMPAAPPIYSAVQARGYYDGWGITGQTRLRLVDPPWWLDGELTGHRVWQINALDRATVDGVAAPPMGVPHGIADWRGYARASMGITIDHWGVAVDVGGVARRGTWEGLEHTTYESTLGVSATLGF